MSAFGVEAPIVPVLVDTPSIRRRRAEATAAAQVRAVWRFEVARIVGETEGTIAQKRQALLDASVACRIKLGKMPSISTIRVLDRKWRIEGCRSAADYRDDATPRGPKSRNFPIEFIAKVIELGQQHGTADLATLLTHVNRAASDLGLDPISTWVLRRILTGIRTEYFTAGRHGSRAAVMDCFPRSTYPTSRTHELWFLDEGDLKYWARGFCRVREAWVSIRPMVILIRDHRSGAFVGFWVSDPSERIDPATGYCLETGFDSDDVLAALMSAACPDVAHPALADVAGALCEQLQWDNAPQHKRLKAALFDRPGAIRLVRNFDDPDARQFVEPEVDSPELETRRIPSRRPDKNGLIERMMGLVKRRLVGRQGHVSEDIPLDRIADGEDLGRSRALAATDPSTRASRLTPVRVRDLPTIAELVDAVADVLAEYNETNVLRRHGMSPRAAAKKYMPRRVRDGSDLIRMLELRQYTVGAGIEVQRDGRSVVFYPMDNGVLLQRGATVEAYVDPKLRRLWLDYSRRLACLKPTEDVARDLLPGDIARTMEEAARTASDLAATGRAERLDRLAGAGAATAAQQAYDEIRRRPRKAAPPASPPSPAAPSRVPSATVAPESSDGNTDFAFDPDALLPSLPPRRDDA